MEEWTTPLFIRKIGTWSNLQLWCGSGYLRATSSLVSFIAFLEERESRWSELGIKIEIVLHEYCTWSCEKQQVCCATVQHWRRRRWLQTSQRNVGKYPFMCFSFQVNYVRRYAIIYAVLIFWMWWGSSLHPNRKAGSEAHLWMCSTPFCVVYASVRQPDCMSPCVVYRASCDEFGRIT